MGSGVFMAKDFLEQIQDDIFSKGFLTVSFSVILILLLIISIERIQLLLDVITFVLGFICSVVMTMIHMKYKDGRTKKQNKIILNNALLFIALTITCAFKIIKHMY